jgi:hypothetical protein
VLRGLDARALAGRAAPATHPRVPAAPVPRPRVDRSRQPTPAGADLGGYTAPVATIPAVEHPRDRPRLRAAVLAAHRNRSPPRRSQRFVVGRALAAPPTRKESDAMLLTIAIVLFVLWALGFLAFHVTTGFIHLLLVVGAIALVVHFVRYAGARRTVV